MSARTPRFAARSFRRPLVTAERLEGRRLFATVGDFVWSDANANGIQDAGEPGVGAVRVQLINASGVAIRTVTTAPNGEYVFGGVNPGTYSVRVTAPANHGFSPANQGADDAFDSDVAAVGTVANTAPFTVAATDTNLTIDAGLLPPVQVTGTVWDDGDADGIRDADEPVRAGASVALEGASLTFPRNTTTNAAGEYTFTLAPRRPFQLRFTTPAGQMPTRANQGTDDTIDSDVDFRTGLSPEFTVPAGGVETSIDAGYVTRSTWSGRVFRDAYADGTPPGGVVGAPGLDAQVVFLDEDGDAVLDPAELWTTTTDDGDYSLPAFPGTATVTAQHKGYVHTSSAADRTRTVTPGDAVAATFGLAPAAPNLFTQPVGPELRLNDPSPAFESEASLGSDALGNYVAVWSGPGGVRGRRFDAADNPLGGEFQVNTTPVASTLGFRPDVAVDADGDFAVAWWGATGAAVARRFAADGTPLGGEFVVSQGTTIRSAGLAVAADPTGGFGVVWSGGSGGALLARRFDANGNPRGDQTQVNDASVSFATPRDLVFDAAGRMTVAYEGTFDVRARRFTAAGAPDGPSFVIDDWGFADDVTVAINPSGERLVVWRRQFDVVARLVAPDNTPRGATFRVSTSTAFDPPAVTARDDGMFMVVYPAGQGLGTQLVSPLGVLHGRESRVGSARSSFYDSPAVAAGAGGTFVVAWHRFEGQFRDIFAQRLETYADADRAEGGGRVWNDDDGDGVQDEGETGPRLFQVDLHNEFGAVVDSAFTDADGNFRFRATRAGDTYRMFVPGLPAGRTLTLANQGDDDTLDSDFDPVTRTAPFTAPAAGTEDHTFGAGIATPPLVTEVFVSGEHWTGAFKAHLAAEGLGDATYGFRITAIDQLNELPWTDLDQVSIRFSEDVVVAADDLAIRGVNVGGYEVKDVGYDAATFTATWRFKHGLVNDKVVIDLDADAGTGVTDVHGTPLNGDWTNPSGTQAGGADAFPTGDNVPGGDFRFRLNALPGDVNRDGVVNAVDGSLVNNARDATPGSGLYSVYFDVDGSGLIDGGDRSRVRKEDGDVLPAADPA